MEHREVLSNRGFDGTYLTSGFVAERLAELGRAGDAPEGALRKEAATGSTLERIASDFDLNPLWPGSSDAPLVPASVLVPLVERDVGLTILLTQRTSHLARHAGQICLPGGRQEPEDRDPVAAALRETQEEIGLPPEQVTVLGQLPPYVTRTGYQVTPVVGLVRPPLNLKLDSFEVADVFEVPIDFVVNPENHQKHSRTAGTETRHFYALPYRERYIWGATAGMLVNFARLLSPP